MLLSIKRSGFLFAIITSLVCLQFCHGNKKELEKYYTNNIALHTILADSLRVFCKKYDTKISIQRYIDTGEHIVFNVLVKDSATSYKIDFDSALKRKDYLELTTRFDIPLQFLKDFKRSKYRSIGVDTTEAFFAYKEDTQGMFARDVSYAGILITAEQKTIGKKEKMIAPGVYITVRHLP